MKNSRSFKLISCVKKSKVGNSKIIRFKYFIRIWGIKLKYYLICLIGKNKSKNSKYIQFGVFSIIRDLGNLSSPDICVRWRKTWRSLDSDIFVKNKLPRPKWVTDFDSSLNHDNISAVSLRTELGSWKTEESTGSPVRFFIKVPLFDSHQRLLSLSLIVLPLNIGYCSVFLIENQPQNTCFLVQFQEF